MHGTCCNTRGAPPGEKWSDIQHTTTPEQRAVAHARAEAILEKLKLHELRKVRRQTQKALAECTGIAQSEISRIEARTNMTLDTLDAYIRGLGGQLEVRAIFPEQIIAIDVPHTSEQHVGKAA